MSLSEDRFPVLERVTKDDLKQLLIRCWMTHDAAWFAGVIDACGIETANRLNRSAVHSMAMVEARRVLRLLDRSPPRSYEELRVFFEAARELLTGDFMIFREDWVAEDQCVRITFDQCHAHRGVTRLGIADWYECGIFERIRGWLDALEIVYRIDPDDPLCTMHHRGWCVRTITFEFSGNARHE